jgi:hypothetical protein
MVSNGAEGARESYPHSTLARALTILGRTARFFHRFEVAAETSKLSIFSFFDIWILVVSATLM